MAWAQRDFRDEDRDANGAKDYWRKDIAGLHLSLKDRWNLPDGLVLADDRPATAFYDGAKAVRGPVKGLFWVRAIRFHDETRPDPDRFAACCFPAAYGPGIRSHYVICQDGVVYKKDLGHGKGIDVYPLDPLKEGWEKVQLP